MNPIILGLIVVLAMNLLIYPIAFKLQTDKLTDITYSLSFATLAIFGLVYANGTNSIPKIILSALVILWAIRLGAFLLYRVSKLGKDDRFDQIRTNPVRFLRFFLIQAIGAWIIAVPFLYRLLENPGTNTSWDSILTIEWIGWGFALIGLIVETVADQQKSNFKNQPNNSSKLFTEGLYDIVRYPNYTGEILFWTGIFIASMPAIYSLRWLAVSSPLIIVFLLVKVTGIPPIERSRKKKLGDDPEYQEYVKNTKLLVPGVY